MIVIDSREKKWEHIKKYFDDNKVEYLFPKKLDAGDYMNTEKPLIVIDRKANLQEICSNLSSGAENIIRFTKEAIRAKENGIRFIVLIEGTAARTTRDVAKWKSKYTKHTGKWLVNKMFEMTLAYNVEWVFCKKNETAKKILELLEYDIGRDKEKH